MTHAAEITTDADPVELAKRRRVQDARGRPHDAARGSRRRLEPVLRALGATRCGQLRRRAGDSAAAPLWALPLPPGGWVPRADAAPGVRPARGFQPALRAAGSA